MPRPPDDHRLAACFLEAKRKKRGKESHHE
jgi:hypothetical protein